MGTELGHCTRTLADWAVSTSAERFGDDALTIVSRSMVDVVGCMLVGSVQPGPRTVRAVVAEGCGTSATGEGPSTLAGFGATASCADAALINAMSAHALDYDDYDMVSYCHPSVVLVPPLLAVAEQGGHAGVEVLVAYLAGYHVMQVLGSVLAPGHYAAGFHATGTIGAVGAAVAVGRLIGLTTDQMTVALAIGASAGAGLRVNFGSSTKPLHAGRAAASGVLAAQLARRGFSASGDVLDDGQGFVGIYAPDGLGQLGHHVGRLLAGEVSILTDPPSIKPYASCGGTHSALAAALMVRSRLGDSSSSIRKVSIEGPSLPLRSVLLHHRPQTGLEAKFSMEGSVAIALVDGRAGVAEFSDDSVRRPQVQDLVARIELLPSEELNRVLIETHDVPIRMTVETETGQERVEVERTPGTAGNPLPGRSHRRQIPGRSRARALLLSGGAPTHHVAALRRSR